MNNLMRLAETLGMPWSVFKDKIDSYVKDKQECHFCRGKDGIVGIHAFVSNKPEYLKVLELEHVVILLLSWCEGCYLDLCFEFERTLTTEQMEKLLDDCVSNLLDNMIRDGHLK